MKDIVTIVLFFIVLFLAAIVFQSFALGAKYMEDKYNNANPLAACNCEVKR
jgi:flagellar basal body-associated protein FliL